MRVIARNTLIRFWESHPLAEQPLKAWFDEVRCASWKTPQEVKAVFRSASVISNKRVVFNIKGNDYRLITDIEYKLGLVFIVWIGSHKEYDKVDVKDVTYDKTD